MGANTLELFVELYRNSNWEFESKKNTTYGNPIVQLHFNDEVESKLGELIRACLDIGHGLPNDVSEEINRYFDNSEESLQCQEGWITLKELKEEDWKENILFTYKETCKKNKYFITQTMDDINSIIKQLEDSLILVDKDENNIRLVYWFSY